MNILGMAKGEPRFANIDKDSWNMILGKMGKLPGELAPEIIELAKKNNLEFYTGTPQDAYPNALQDFRKEMEENNWDTGEDEEELFELAMHDRQYRDYKTGVAKKNFEKELETAKNKSNIQIVVKEIKAPEVIKEEVIAKVEAKYPNAKQVVATVSGIVIWELPVTEQSMPKPLGTAYKEGDIVCWINAYFGNDEVKTLYAGKLCAVIAQQGDKVKKGDIVAFVE